MLLQLIISNDSFFNGILFQNESDKLKYITDYLDISSLFLNRITKYTYRIPLAVLTGESLIYTIEQLKSLRNSSFYVINNKKLSDSNSFNSSMIFEHSSKYWGLLFSNQ